MTTFSLGDAAPIDPHLYAEAPVLAVFPQAVDAESVQGYLADAEPSPVAELVATGLGASSYTGNTYPAEEVDITPGLTFFERFHVVPRKFDFGNLLSAQSPTIEVFNAFRRPPDREWTAVVNNAGAGVSLGGQPALPTDISPLFSVEMTLDVALAGDPIVDGDLTFTFLSGTTQAIVPIEIQRIVLFGVEPEMPFKRFLEFVTDVRRSLDGSEKRHRIRYIPRSAWNYRYLIEEGLEAQRIENALVEYQGRNWGSPIWDEDSLLSDNLAAGSTVITVDSTAFREFYVGGFVVIRQDQETFDVLQIDAGGITATTLTVTSPTLNAYTAGARVFPLATCRMAPSITGNRYAVRLRSRSVTFTSTVNDNDIADLSAFNSFNSRLFLDNGNSLLSATVGIVSRQRQFVMDGEAGEVFVDTIEGLSLPALNFTLRAFGRQAKYEMLQMLYAIGGRHRSFYVPTDADDLTAAGDLTSGASTIDVTNTGYAQFVRHRKPYNTIRVSLVDGTTYERSVTNSESISLTVDRLTISGTWPANVAVADIARVDYVFRVRFDVDRIEIQFPDGDRAYLVAPVVGALD